MFEILAFAVIMSISAFICPAIRWAWWLAASISLAAVLWPLGPVGFVFHAYILHLAIRWQPPAKRFAKLAEVRRGIDDPAFIWNIMPKSFYVWRAKRYAAEVRRIRGEQAAHDEEFVGDEFAEYDNDHDDHDLFPAEEMRRMREEVKTWFASLS
jgi:hypothetical protein